VGKTTSGSYGSEYWRGINYVVMSTLSFSIAASLVKANSAVPAFEIGLVRALFSIIVAYLSCRLIFEQSFFLPAGAPRRIGYLLIARGLVDVMGTNLFYFGCGRVSLGLVTVIMFTSPFWTGLISWAWLGESYTRKDLLLACVAFLGVVLTAVPEIQGPEHTSMSLILFILPCGLLQGITYCCIKRLATDCHFMQMTSSYGVCGTFLCSALIFCSPKMEKVQQANTNNFRLAVLHDFHGLWLAVLASGFAVAAQMLLNLGCARVEASAAALVRTLDIPLSIAIQAIFFNNGAQPVQILGAGLVVVACSVLAAMKLSEREEKWEPMRLA